MRSIQSIRAAKTGYLILSALFCALGILLIALPGFSVSLVGILSGALLLVFGVVKLAGYFSRDLYQLAFQFDLAFGLLMIVLGVIILINPDRALSFLCLVLGVVILMDALFKLQSSLDARRFGLRTWGLLLGLAICSGVIGAALALHPAQSARALMVLLGVGLLFEGILNLCVGIFAIKVIRRQPTPVEYWIDQERQV